MQRRAMATRGGIREGWQKGVKEDGRWKGEKEEGGKTKGKKKDEWMDG